MWEVLAFGTLPFWILLGANALLLLFFINMEKLGAATWTILLSLAAFHFFGGQGLAFVIQNPQAIALWAVAYLGVGVLWSIAKWWFYVKDQRWRYDELKNVFLEDHKVASITPELKAAWALKISCSHIDARPEAGSYENKTRICGWITYWPWSLAWTLVNDPVKRVVRFVYRSICNILQKISDRAFAGTENDYE